MKTLALNLWTASIAWMLCACSPQPKPMNSELPVLDLTKEYPGVHIDVHDIAEVKYIPLETNDESVLDGYTADFRISDNYIVVHGRTEVYIFNGEGKFLRKVGHYGQGPHENFIIFNCAVDFEREECYIDDRQKIQVHSLSGEWKRTLKFPKGVKHHGLFDCSEKYLIGGNNEYEDFLYPEKFPRDKTPYYLIDKETGEHIPLPLKVENRVSRFFHMEFEEVMNNKSREPYFGALPIASMYANGRDILIADFGLDTLYSYKDDKLTPIAVQYPSVHSGDTHLLFVPLRYTDSLLFYQAVEMKYVPENLREPVEEAPPLMWNRNTNTINEVRLYDSNWPKKTIIWDMKFKRFEQPNCFLSLLNAERLCEEYEEGNLKGELKEVASKLKFDDNMVVAIYKLK